MNILPYIIVIFAAFGGFLLAFYIRHKKQSREKMVCPLDSDCDAVIYSQYSKFLGFPVELLGIFYYSLVAVSYAVFLVLPNLATPLAVFGVLAATTSAFLFSLYLTFIQAFSLRQWCTWCLGSAGLCSIIFLSAIFGSELGFISLLEEYYGFVLVLHALGAALGVGAATITDIFFFKFLKDFKISEWESEVMHTLSQIIWFALGILVITGLGLYLTNAEVLNQTPKFIVKAVGVAVLIINGAFLNLLISPKLIKISFGGAHAHEEGELRYIRKWAFALGAVSITSWYSVFLLGLLSGIKIDFWPLLFTYFGVVAGGVLISQFMERYFSGHDEG